MTQRKPGPTLVTKLQPLTKLFVLDTNVLMHDPTSLFHFQEHDVYLPMVTLEDWIPTRSKSESRATPARPPLFSPIVTKAVEDIPPASPGNAGPGGDRTPVLQTRGDHRRATGAFGAVKAETRSSVWSSICRRGTTSGK